MTENVMPPFHLAFPVSDLGETRHFYVKVIGCTIGREAEKWIDFNFFGHQISAHLKPEAISKSMQNAVDGDAVPVRHFGAVLPWNEWEALAKRLTLMGQAFRIEPKVRFQDLPGEQGTFFIDDPAGNALEFKTFKNMNSLFQR